MARGALTRRQALVAGVGFGAAAIGGTAFAEVARSGATIVAPSGPFSGRRPVIAGKIAAVRESSLLLDRFAGGDVIIHFAEDARIWREGRTTVTAFSPGERVIAEGDWDGSSFLASALMDVYSTVSGTVTKQTRRRLHVGNTELVFIGATRRRDGELLIETSPAEFAAGEHLTALGRHRADGRTLVALQIERV